MYSSYKTAHKLPGVILDGHLDANGDVPEVITIPTAVDDVTSIIPEVGEMRADVAYIYVCTASNGIDTVVWSRTALTAWA